jgi:hypothetical protein
VRAVVAAPATRPDRYTVLNRLDLSEPVVRDLLTDVFGRAPGRTGGTPGAL